MVQHLKYYEVLRKNGYEQSITPNIEKQVLIPDYDRSDTNNKGVVNKKYVDGTTFTLDVSKSLDMKGNKVINVADPTRATDGSDERHGDTKASNYLKTDGTRVMTGNLKMNNRSIIMPNRHNHVKAEMLLMLILSIQLSTIIIH